ARRRGGFIPGCFPSRRPDICSAARLASIRPPTTASGSLRAAASRPAISPRYSATLLVAVPIGSATSASTSPPAASRTTAPNPAGPALPRDPPSAPTASLRPIPGSPGLTAPPRWSAPRTSRRRPPPPACAPSRSPPSSQPRFGGPHQDPPAVLAAQHLVGGGLANPAQRGRAQRQLAPLAPAVVQRRRPDPVLVPQLGVERQQ